MKMESNNELFKWSWCLLISQDVFCDNFKEKNHASSSIQNPVKHLKWNAFTKIV